MEEELITKVMQEVIKRVGGNGHSNGATATAVLDEPEVVKTPPRLAGIPTELVQLTEFVGAGMGDTQGIVIANLDPAIHKLIGFDPKFRSIGVIGGRTGAGPHLMAADEAIKATNTEIILVEMPRDTKGGAGHGNLIIFGAEDVSDARRAVEVTLECLPKYFGDVYANDQGYTENQYTARASKVLKYALGAPEGRAFVGPVRRAHWHTRPAPGNRWDSAQWLAETPYPHRQNPMCRTSRQRPARGVPPEANRPGPRPCALLQSPAKKLRHPSPWCIHAAGCRYQPARHKLAHHWDCAQSPA